MTSSFTRPHSVHTWPPHSHRQPRLLLIRSLVTISFTRPHHVQTWPHPIQTWPTSYHNHTLIHMWPSSSHVKNPLHTWPSRSHGHIPFTRCYDYPIQVAFYHCFTIDNNVNISSPCSKTVHTKFIKPLSFKEAIIAHQLEAKIFTSFPVWLGTISCPADTL